MRLPENLATNILKILSVQSSGTSRQHKHFSFFGSFLQIFGVCHWLKKASHFSIAALLVSKVSFIPGIQTIYYLFRSFWLFVILLKRYSLLVFSAGLQICFSRIFYPSDDKRCQQIVVNHFNKNTSRPAAISAKIYVLMDHVPNSLR